MYRFIFLLTIQLAVIQSFGQNINRAILDSIIRQSERTNADALLIYKDGKLVHKNYYGKPVKKIEVMSASKSVVSIAIGLLQQKGFIKSIDDSVSKYYPEWKQGNKRAITIRQLLNHTSGLQNLPNAGIEVEVAPDVIQLALCAELDAVPGTVFSYNNKATNLLSGIIKKTSGMHMDVFLAKYLFNNLGIKDFFWVKDKAGNPLGMSGLNILPEDFAKIGQLILDGGKWKGKQLLSQDWIREMFTPYTPQSNYGLEWWLVYEKQSMIIDDDLIQKLKADSSTALLMQKIKGRYTNGMNDVRKIAMSVYTQEELQQVGKALSRLNPSHLRIENEGRIQSYVASGYLGQFLIIVPEKNIVLVKMISTESHRKIPNNSDFSQIRNLALEL